MMEPITREEKYLAKAAGNDVETPEPITRKEFFLDAIAKNVESGGGGAGGGGGYMIHVPAEEISTDDDDVTTIMLSESYDNFMPILAAGGSVWLDLTKAPPMAELGLLFVATPITSAFYLPGMGLMLLASNGVSGGTIQVNCPNGTWLPETEE